MKGGLAIGELARSSAPSPPSPPPNSLSSPSSSDWEAESVENPSQSAIERGKPALNAARTVTSVSASFVVEELSDFADSDGDERLDCIRPHAIDQPESDNNRGSRPQRPKVIDPEVLSDLAKLSCGDTDDTDFDEAEYQEFLRRLRERKRRARMGKGKTPAGLKARTFSEIATLGSDDNYQVDLEDLQGSLPIQEAGSSARRLRRRIGERHELIFQDPPLFVSELDEPDSSDDEISEALVRELPYFEYTAMEIDSDGGTYTGNAQAKAWATSIPSFKGKNIDNQWMELDRDAGSDHSTEDSDMSDLESIVSEAASLASSQSSVPTSVNLGAIDELRMLLQTNEALKPLYEVAISKVGPERFHRNFGRLLVRYGRDLGTEATSTLQSKAARFVRFAASRVAMQIKDSFVDKEARERKKYTSNAKVLGAYFKSIQDVKDASDGDDSDHDPEDTSLQTLESVRNFMISSAAFSNLCRSLRVWLTLDDQDEHESTHYFTIAEAGTQDTIRANVLTTATTPDTVRPQEKRTELVALSQATAKEDVLLKRLSFKIRDDYARQVASYWLLDARAVYNCLRNILSGLWQAEVPPGEVRISWTCRCGDVLRIQVPESQERAAIAFARQAADPNTSTVLTQRPHQVGGLRLTGYVSTVTNTTTQGPSRPSLRPHSSNISASTDTTAGSYSTSATSRSAASRPESPNTLPSDEELSQPESFIPVGTKKFMLLCVNTSGPSGIVQRKLANVDITDVECGAEMFQRLRNAYYALRGNRNPFLVPKSMHYVKFQLLFLQKSGECIGAYEINSIPSSKEVFKQEYAFSPCPPRIGKLPLPPDIFMHGFLDPGDHLGPMAVDILPKKLWCQLRWDAQANDRYNVPAGWGFYIVEGINWPLVSWCAAVALLGVTILTVTWSVWTEDVQGGTGLGQYCLAVLTLSVSVWLLKYSVRDGL